MNMNLKSEQFISYPPLSNHKQAIFSQGDFAMVDFQDYY